MRSEREYLRRGAATGAQTGCILAGIYAVLLIPILLLLTLALSSSNPLGRTSDERLADTMSAIAVAIPLGLIAGALPSLGLGTLAGLTIAWVLKHSHRQDKYSAGLLGVLIGVAIAAVFHILTWRLFEPAGWSGVPHDFAYFINFFQSNFLILGFPTLIGILACGWMGWKLHQEFKIT